MRYLILIALLFSFSAIADSGKLDWVAPTEREDGAQLSPSEIGGFRLYNSSGQIGGDIPPNIRTLDITIENVEQTLHMTTYDTDGRESAPSQPVIVAAGKGNPLPQTETITITIGN